MDEGAASALGRADSAGGGGATWLPSVWLRSGRRMTARQNGAAGQPTWPYRTPSQTVGSSEVVQSTRCEQCAGMLTKSPGRSSSMRSMVSNTLACTGTVSSARARMSPTVTTAGSATRTATPIEEIPQSIQAKTSCNVHDREQHFALQMRLRRIRRSPPGSLSG